MKKTSSILSFFILLMISYLNLISCKSNEDTVSCFPQRNISVSLNLNLATYNNLNYIGGWVYINEQQSGTNGLIVVRSGDTPATFKVYDRNAPHLCPDNGTILEVKDNISIVCPKDNASWILLTGQPTNISSVPPKTYFWSYDANSKNLNLYN